MSAILGIVSEIVYPALCYSLSRRHSHCWQSNHQVQSSGILMEDELAFGGAWDDQVSVTHSSKNSSSASLSASADQNDKSRSELSPPPADESTTAGEDTTAESPSETKENEEESVEEKKPDVSKEPIAKTTPRSSRIRSAYRSRTLRKGHTTELEIESSDSIDPLGGAVENEEDDVGIAKDKSSAESPTSFQDVPLNVSSGGSSATPPTGDHMISAGLKQLQVGEKKENHAAVNSAGDSSFGSSEPAPTFNITVGDPIKVGDITSAHTVYTVHTTTNSPSFGKSEMAVTRRYKDFRWLFHALENNNQGIIVPPPPEKQAVGRFREDFVEQRRSALENMLNKAAKHPVLSNDPDLRLFLESDAFSNDIKNRVVTPEELEQANSSGIMSTLGGAFSFSGKFIETNQWFVDKKNYIDGLETQLKSLAKALDIVVTQRRELSDNTGEFALILDSLSDLEISKSLSELFESFSAAHVKIKELYARQCMQDIMSLANTLDEYIRVISSVRSVFSQRQKSFFNVQQAEHELLKKRSHLEKLLRQGRTQQDKISVLEQEVESQEQKVVNNRVAFDDITKVIQREFQRIEQEKIEDFRNSVELFLENAVESQKAAIEIWETFYQHGFPPAAESQSESQPRSEPAEATATATAAAAATEA